MNILVLMSGSDKTFLDAGYLYPKSLIEIHGSPVIEHVIQKLSPLIKLGAKIIFVLKKEECKTYHTDDVIYLLAPDATLVQVEESTKGAACSALLAIEHVQNSEPLLVINGDIIIKDNLLTIIEDFSKRNLDGGVVVFESVHPRWSYVKCDEQGYVIEAAEKRPISKLATVGCYYFLKGSDFVSSLMDMIRKGAEINGSFYVCPSFNEMVLKQKKIGIYKIPQSSYFSLATPQNIKEYESSSESKQIKK